MKETESCLRNLYMNFMFRCRPDSYDKLSRIDKFRWLGGMEALLQALGVIPSLVPWDLKVTRKKFLFIPYNAKETYEEYILRITLKFLKESPNTPGTTFR